MAYSTSNPPRVIGDSIGGAGTLWLFRSTDDDATTNGTGYYTNGVALGMVLGDIVLVIDTTTPKGSTHYVSSSTGDTVTTSFAVIS